MGWLSTVYLVLIELSLALRTPYQCIDSAGDGGRKRRFKIVDSVEPSWVASGVR